MTAGLFTLAGTALVSWGIPEMQGRRYSSQRADRKCWPHGHTLLSTGGMQSVNHTCPFKGRPVQPALRPEEVGVRSSTVTFEPSVYLEAFWRQTLL